MKKEMKKLLSYLERLRSNKKNPLSSKRGFTLIELLVVITILGILATGGVATFRSAREKARDGIKQSDLGQLASGIRMRTDQTIGNGIYAPKNMNTCTFDMDMMVFENHIEIKDKHKSRYVYYWNNGLDTDPDDDFFCMAGYAETTGKLICFCSKPTETESCINAENDVVKYIRGDVDTLGDSGFKIGDETYLKAGNCATQESDVLSGDLYYEVISDKDGGIDEDKNCENYDYSKCPPVASDGHCEKVEPVDDNSGSCKKKAT